MKSSKLSGAARNRPMKHRFTIQQLQDWSDAEILRMLVTERMNSVSNANAPLYQRLKEVRANLERQIAQEEAEARQETDVESQVS